MKIIVCEVCGSQRFLKQEGIYVCEGCATKYTVAEINKLITEVPDPAPAAAPAAEPSSELEKLYKSAREAKDAGDIKNAAKHYETIFSKDPGSWEAAFYGSYFRAKDSTVWQVRSAANAVRNGVSTSLKLIHTQVRDRAQQVAAVQDVAMHAMEIANFLYDRARAHFTELSPEEQINNKLIMVNDCSAAKDILLCLGDDVDTLFGGYTELQAVAANAWKSGVDKHSSLLEWSDYKETGKGAVMEYVPKIQKYDSAYKPPQVKGKRRGCYVATAVYGSYDCPEVWTLRRYRDRVLAETRRGRAFIRFYYAVSPHLVAWFGNAAWFRRLWKPGLDRFVARLNAAGLADTPYRDEP